MRPRAQPGLDAAWLRLMYESHATPLVLYARTWLARSDAEDVVQEAFVKLLSRTDRPNEPRAWLLRVVRNAVFARWRAGDRRHEQPLAGETAGALLATPPEAPVSAADVQAILLALPADHREVVVLRIWCGQTFEQIAELTGQALSTVYRIHQSSLAQARARLEASCPPPKT